MSTNILFVFEGEKTEKIIVRSLENHFLKGNMIGNIIITCAFEAEIYQLYRKMQEDSDLDTFNLIKNKNPKSKDLLKDYNRDDFAEIYLFFDYDGQSSLASSQDRYGNKMESGDDKLAHMLALFDNETDKGKLYISYPMVESLRHIINFDTFFELTVKSKGVNCIDFNDCCEKEKCQIEPHYKQRISQESIPQLCNINGYSSTMWKQLIRVHLFKMNYIVNEKFEYPHALESQKTIFSKQLEKYICKPCHPVSVLSAFPLFIHDYFGNNKTMEITN